MWSVDLIINIYHHPGVFPPVQSGHLYDRSQVCSATLIAAGPTLQDRIVLQDDQTQPRPLSHGSEWSELTQFAAREPHVRGWQCQGPSLLQRPHPAEEHSVGQLRLQY